MAEPAQPVSETERFSTDHRYTFGIADMAVLNLVIFRRSGLRWVVAAALGVGALICSKAAVDSVAWLCAGGWWSGRNSNSLLLPTGVELSADGVRTRSSATDFNCRWSVIRRVVRRRDRLFLFMTDRMAFIVPRRLRHGGSLCRLL